MPTTPADARQYTERWVVRTYEVDENGHVNNAVFVQWAEHLSARHAEALGFGRAWSLERGGAWLVRRHEVTYHRPTLRGEEVELTVRVLGVRGVRGQRETTIRRATDDTLLAEVASEWVWVRVADGRPAAVPREIVDAFRGGNKGLPQPAGSTRPKS